MFLALDVLTFGFFASLWFFINYKAINFLAKTEKDTIKFKWLVLLLLISLLVYVFYVVTLDFNPYYVFFFSVLYLVHFIDTYTDRVDNSHEYFDFRSPQGMALIILLVIFALIMNFKPYFGF